MENISQINPYSKTLSWTSNSPFPRRKINRKRKSISRMGRAFHSLTRLAHDTHQRLVEQNSPVRICIYKNDEDLFMDVVVMDDGENNKHFSRSITNESEQTLTRQIHKQMGLVLDYSI